MPLSYQSHFIHIYRAWNLHAGMVFNECLSGVKFLLSYLGSGQFLTVPLGDQAEATLAKLCLKLHPSLSYPNPPLCQPRETLKK